MTSTNTHCATELWQQLWQQSRNESDIIQKNLPFLESENIWLAIVSIVAPTISFRHIALSNLRKILLDAINENSAMTLQGVNCSTHFSVLPLQQSLLNYLHFIAESQFCGNVFQTLLYSFNFHAICLHKVTHLLWHKGHKSLAQYIQSRTSKCLRIDIHPLSIIGERLFMPNCSGIVIGATAVVEDDVTLGAQVTLGGSGKQREDRHPKVRSSVKIGTGAQLLGNIEIGESTEIAPDSVVLKTVKAGQYLAGVPARVVK